MEYLKGFFDGFEYVPHLQQRFKVIYELKMYYKIKLEFYCQIEYYKPTDGNCCLTESDPDVFTETRKLPSCLWAPGRVIITVNRT